MNRFKGDAAAVAKASALGTSIMTFSAMFATPLMSVLSDTHGRKALMLLSPIWAIMARTVETIFPTVRVMQTSTALAAVSLGTVQGVKTCIGDLFVGDPKGAGAAMA